jgi:hypothetical protein
MTFNTIPDYIPFPDMQGWQVNVAFPVACKDINAGPTELRIVASGRPFLARDNNAEFPSSSSGR